MKSLSLASVVFVSLSIGCARGFSWDDLEHGDLYIRDLDILDLDTRDSMGDFESELLERDFMDEIEEQLHIRDVPSRNKRILDNIATTKKEMFAVYKDMSKKIEGMKKKYPLTKDTGKATEEFLKTIAQANKKESDKKTAKKTNPKSKSSKKKEIDYDDVQEDFEDEKSGKKTGSERKSSEKKTADFDDVEEDFLRNRATIDLVADAKPNAIVRCDMLLKSFKPDSELVQILNYAEKHLKWDKWQYMEWDLLTIQAAQMSLLMSTCNAAQIDGLSTRIGKVWTPFSKVVADLAGITKKSGMGGSEKLFQLAKDTVGTQGALAS